MYNGVERYCYDPLEVIRQVSIHQERLRYDMKNLKLVCIAAQMQTEYLWNKRLVLLVSSSFIFGEQFLSFWQGNEWYTMKKFDETWC